MKIQEILTKVLEPLRSAHDKEAVARILREAGAYGKVGCAQVCAVANYLRAGVEMQQVTAPVKVDVRTTGGRDNTVNVEFIVGSETYRYRLPRPVAEFVEAFDRGEYPDLDIMNREHM